MIAPANLFAQKFWSVEKLKSQIFECGNQKTKSRSKTNRTKNEFQKFQFSEIEKRKIEIRRKRNDASPPLADHLRATICGRRIEVEAIRDELCIRVTELLIDLDRRDWLFDAIERTPASSFVQHRGVTLTAAISHDHEGRPFLLARWLERFHDSPARAWYVFARGIQAIEATACEIDRQWRAHESGKNPTFRAYAQCA